MNNVAIMNGISILNGAAVCVFGIILSASFSDMVWTKQKNRFMCLVSVGLLLLQGVVYFLLSSNMVRYLYPFITHIPLAIMLCVMNKKRLWSVISVFTAYLCCQLRRWLALLIVAVFHIEPVWQELSELLLTFPLLFVLVKFVAPAVRSVSHFPISMQYQFGIIPVLAYGFDYLTQIYTNIFAEGTPVVTEFMSFVCSGAYLVFVIRISEENRLRNQLEQTQESLNLQIVQAVRQIELLRESQQQAGTYRHDLRHHMQYLSACIENGQLGRAQEYIHGIYSEIEAKEVTFFCENEAANLIFSAFVGKAEEQGISLKIRAEIPRIIPVSESDLCVLLSNALENAINACQKLKTKGLHGSIEVSAYEKNAKLFLQISNSCDKDVTFDKGIPVTDEPGHGIGVRSICALVERYRGLYTFTVRDDRFILRVSL